MDGTLCETEGDVAEIRRLIARETAASAACDFDAWSTMFVHEPRTTEVSCTFDRGVLVTRGWQAIASAMRRQMDEIGGHQEGSRSDIEVSASGDMAWARCRSSCHGSGLPPYDTERLRILERCEGHWRIVYIAWAVMREVADDRPLVVVDAKARVFRATGETLRALDAFAGLEIAGGCIRASDPSAQQRFRETVARASRSCGTLGIDCRRHAGRSHHFPCILGAAVDGGVLHCTVFVHDGQVNVTFDNGEMARSKAAIVSDIFALSATQARVVREIVAGQTLSGIAGTLEISVNTVRTHLQRVYDKTGVSSVTALVRLVLSMS